jgi:hypothetical protein
MSNKAGWELSEWGGDNGDGSVRLVYWDYLHGNDVVIRIDKDGVCYRQTGYVNGTSDETWEHIPNLGLALIEINNDIEASHE